MVCPWGCGQCPGMAIVLDPTAWILLDFRLILVVFLFDVSSMFGGVSLDHCWLPIGFVWDVHWICTGLSSDGHRRSLDLHWSSVGFTLDMHWILIWSCVGALLDFRWISPHSIGCSLVPVGLRRISVGSLCGGGGGLGVLAVV